jgi:nitroimidazol reductase NimA-like FMN-containing flavoprotein (pyridoxamine 5'-phosphate oxidase superfamily)
MLGELSEKQVEDILTQQVTGRLGCCARGIVYVVPINYVYNDGTIYAHSGLGKKIEMMRKNPRVCFEVDEIENIFRWQCVIAWGIFEEITDIDEKQQVMQGIIHRIMPLADNPDNHPSHGITANEYDIGNTVELIVYKIKITKKTGKFEYS